MTIFTYQKHETIFTYWSDNRLCSLLFFLLPKHDTANRSSYVDEWTGDEDYYESDIDDIDVEVYVDIDDQDLDLTVRVFQDLVLFAVFNFITLVDFAMLLRIVSNFFKYILRRTSSLFIVL